MRFTYRGRGTGSVIMEGEKSPSTLIRRHKMIIDAQNLFSDAQALTATAVSTNVIDLGADRNIGIGEPMAVVVCIDVALDGTTTDETYVVTVQSGSTATPTTVIATRTITYTEGVIGAKFVLPLPADTSADRYLRVNYTLGGTTPTGTVTTFLTPMSMIQNNAIYADGITIS